VISQAKLLQDALTIDEHWILVWMDDHWESAQYDERDGHYFMCEGGIRLKGKIWWIEQPGYYAIDFSSNIS